MPKNNIPLFMDYAFEIPKGVTLESKTQSNDCATWSTKGIQGTDDD